MKKLAIIDWGIGGLGFWKKWRERFPDQGLVYYSDAGFTPYGKLSHEQMLERLVEIFRELKERGVTHVMIACNAASTVLDELQKVEVGLRIGGVILPTLEWLREEFGEANPALIGGVRTVSSGAYRDMVGLQIVGQPLSALVEAGVLEGEEVENTLGEVLGSLSGDLVLACTHYVALTPLISRLYPALRVYDPMAAVVDWAIEEWGDFPVGGGDLFLTSGDEEAMCESALKAFGVEIRR